MVVQSNPNIDFRKLPDRPEHPDWQEVLASQRSGSWERFWLPSKPHYPFQRSQMIESPTSPELRKLCDRLSVMTPAAESKTDADAWPHEKLRLCAEAGVYRWFVPVEVGGLGWSESDIAAGYLQLSAACLTTTFILTQQVSALRRVAGTPNEYLRAEVLPNLVTGSSTATVAISHLTTSRRHLGFGCQIFRKWPQNQRIFNRF